MGAFSYNNCSKEIKQDVFVSKGHKNIKKIDISREERFVCCNKILVNNKNFLRLGDDFIVGVGTYVYNKLFAYNALKEIWNDFQVSDCTLRYKLYGHYAFILKKNGVISIFTDRAGVFRVYYAMQHESIYVSTSMLSVVEQMEEPKIDNVKAAINVCGFFGREIPFVQGVEILGGNKFIQIKELKARIFDRCSMIEEKHIVDLNEAIGYVKGLINEQIEQFKYIQKSLNKEGFDSVFSVEITGGLDSRLLSGILRYGKLNYSYVHYPLFGPDKEIADIIATTLNKKIEIIENLVESNNYKIYYGEYDSRFNLLGHYPNQRWKIPHLIKFSGLRGECISTADIQQKKYEKYSVEQYIDLFLKNSMINNSLLEPCKEYMVNDVCSNLKIKRGVPLSQYQVTLLVQFIYAQRTGDGFFLSAMGAHLWSWSIYNEAWFILSAANIDVDVRRKRKLTIALIKDLDSKLATLPFVSHRRTRRNSVDKIKELPEVSKSYNGIKNLMPRFVVDFLYKKMGRRMGKSLLISKLDFNRYSNIVKVCEMQKYPNLNSEYINRLASLDAVVRLLNIK